MPAISFFADGRDVHLLLDRLKADPEIAFIVSDGYLRWKAVPAVDQLTDWSHSLWHIPGGPLPLAGGRWRKSVPDPWSGWTERQHGSDFGHGPATGIELEVWTRSRRYSLEEKESLSLQFLAWQDKDVLLASELRWVGGNSEAPPTRRWWQRTRAWFDRSATRLGDGRTVFWAFPSALHRLKGGLAYDTRGYDLTQSIKAANERPSDLVSPRKVEADPAWFAWNGGTVPAMARRIFDERAFADLPVLADALEEAGCTNQDILMHCREEGPHGRGCWVVELLLGEI